jgi:hypothetical protein
MDEWRTPIKMLELRHLLADTEFFILGEVLPHGMKILLEDLSLYQKVRPENTIIRTAGSYQLMKHDKLLLAWLRENWMFAGPYSDWFISGKIGRMAPVNYICPTDKMPVRNEEERDKLRICTAPTSVSKGYPDFRRVALKIIKKYEESVDIKIIANTPWKEAMKIKARCDVTFDQFMLTHYSSSAIESMYLEHAVLSRISSWCKLLHPDLPILPVDDEDELYDALVFLIEHQDMIKEIGKKCKEYVLHYHTPKFVAEQWAYLIDHVTNPPKKRTKTGEGK